VVSLVLVRCALTLIAGERYTLQDFSFLFLLLPFLFGLGLGFSFVDLFVSRLGRNLFSRTVQMEVSLRHVGLEQVKIGRKEGLRLLCSCVSGYSGKDAAIVYIRLNASMNKPKKKAAIRAAFQKTFFCFIILYCKSGRIQKK